MRFQNIINLLTTLSSLLLFPSQKVLDETFSVTVDDFGAHREEELVPGGKDMKVTEGNKGSYVEAYTKWRLYWCFHEQLQAIAGGLNEVS